MVMAKWSLAVSIVIWYHKKTKEYAREGYSSGRDHDCYYAYVYNINA